MAILQRPSIGNLKTTNRQYRTGIVFHGNQSISGKLMDIGLQRCSAENSYGKDAHIAAPAAPQELFQLALRFAAIAAGPIGKGVTAGPAPIRHAQGDHRPAAIERCHDGAGRLARPGSNDERHGLVARHTK